MALFHFQEIKCDFHQLGFRQKQKWMYLAEQKPAFFDHPVPLNLMFQCCSASTLNFLGPFVHEDLHIKLSETKRS